MHDSRIRRSLELTPSLFPLVLAAALVLVPTAAAGPSTHAQDGSLSVTSVSFSGGSVTVIEVASADAVAKVAVSAPAGYGAELAAPPGTRVGFVSAGLSDVPGTTSSSASGDLVAQDPSRHVGTPESESCAPGRHAAVWSTTLSVLGQSFTLPIYVDPEPSSEGSAVVLRFCPVWPSSVLPAGVTAHGLALFVEGVIAKPTAPGRYTWSALVSPPLANLAPDASHTFEVRAVEPVPHTVTLRARHDPKRKTVVLSGKLTAAGQPEAGAQVDFAAVTGSFSETTFFGPATTNAAGEFSVKRTIDSTMEFSASVTLPDAPCSTSSTAPAGCIRETVSGPPGASTFVRVRTAADPKLALRKKDQALARRANLRLADFPAGWEAFDSFSVFACEGFTPRLSDLTATGDVESRIFASEEANAASRATVYVSEAQARTAFARTARLAEARCVADEVRADGYTVLQLGAIPFASLGDETRAFRVVFSRGEFVLDLDFVSFRQGRTVVHLGFVSVTQPLVIADDLAAGVAARARSG